MKRPVPEAIALGLDVLLAGMLGFFALRFFVIAAFLLPLALGRLGPAEAALLILKPLLWLVLAALPVLALRRRKAPRLLLMAAGALACAACVLALHGAHAPTRANELGLASFEAGVTQTQDFSQTSQKDRYPVCRFAYNSLGWRDIEPPSGPKGGRRLVLLIGDSFVWGDGIPSNEETLAYRLRAELDRRAPGRYLVMSAAYPGLGLYGYSRFAEALAPRFAPDVVVLGYLGEPDHDPFDVQALLQGMPADRRLRNLVLNLGAAQHVHETSVRRERVLWGSPRNAALFAGLREELSRKASSGGYRLIFLCYKSCADLPASLEKLELPSGLRYAGRSSELWYARDYHPKPELNRILAADLAAAVMSGRQPRRTSRR